MSPLSVLVASCDRYADVWSPFFTLFWKYWPDCPYPVYLGANRQIYPDERIKMVLTGDDPSWAESARRMVDQVESSYILMLLEDFFISKLVNTKQIEYCSNALRELKGGYLRLKPFPKPDRKVPGYRVIGEIDRGAPYRSALQAAIWHKDVLLKLLVNGESAWDMELIGSRRSDAMKEGYYSSWKPMLVYEAGVTKGEWLPWAVDLCNYHGIRVDLDKRKVMSSEEYAKQLNKRIFWKLVNNIPWRWRRPVGNMLRRSGFLLPWEGTVK